MSKYDKSLNIAMFVFHNGHGSDAAVWQRHDAENQDFATVVLALLQGAEQDL